PHDTVRSCGYRIKTSDGRACAVCTDLGHVTETVRENITGCDLVLLESNYDEKLLRNGPYPYYLKERIRSDHGHLSNVDCAQQAAELIRTGTTQLILGHLSQENNTPYKADQTVEEGLSEFVRNRDYILEVAPVETTGKMVVF
ncbi:MAG: MBL fold metallo-hydrolase, partial [Porcipelethomonas sp.]